MQRYVHFQAYNFEAVRLAVSNPDVEEAIQLNVLLLGVPHPQDV